MKITLLILLSLLALLTPLTGSARPQGQIVAIDNSVFVAMVDSSIESCIHVQDKDNWCWAACVQMALQYNGIYKSQTEIVRQVYGSPYNWTASGNEIAEALNGWNGFRVRSFNTKTPQSFIDEIAAGNPMIIGYEEHAYLLTHIYYKKALNGRLSPFKVIMINPKLGKEEVFDWNNVYDSLNTIVSIHPPLRSNSFQ